MNERVRLYQIHPSPNNLKVRLGLGYKGIPYESVPVDPQDRAEVVRISRQPLTPVLQHGKTVIFDSAAILRYLEANFPNSPSLYSPDRDTMREIERWEWYARSQLSDPTVACFQMLRGAAPLSAAAAASEQLNALTGRIEERLAAAPFLVGDRVTAADLINVPFVFLGMISPQKAAASEVWRFFRQHLELGAGRQRTRDWCERLMVHDRAPVGATS